MENEIFIKNKGFQDLISNSREKFINKFKYQPKVITVSLYEDKENVKLVKTFTCAFLNIDEEDKEIFDRKYVGATSIDSTLVLIVDKPAFSSSLFEVKNSKKDFYVFYGNKIDFCEQEFTVGISNVFTLKKTLWSYELITE
ncbi:hypothetical protein G4D82_09765 [Flavobacterium sp. CYK-4]|uniref:hypothetical protein n=1 Tax=Flavobacterium lotistagni TaxID=2709660 RepID=UPI00140A66E2|nr:hypothetical protein [Flavobacterium lotistagni]NHM07506.1 hypothetical protein [Flavobacterium lotistagni]